MRAGPRTRCCLLALLVGSACADDPPGGLDAGAPDSGAPSGDASDVDAGTSDAGPGDGGSDAAIDAGADDAGVVAPGGRWETLAPLAAGPRQETAVLELDGAIYVIGGFDDNSQIVATVEAYDPTLDQWTRKADLPLPLHHANAAVVAGKIYIVGALGPSFLQLGSILAYDPALDQWSELGQMPANEGRGSSGVAVIGDRIYLVGGYRSFQAVPTVTAFEPATMQFESLPALPSALDHLTVAVVDQAIFVIGGRLGAINSMQASVYAWRPGDLAWTPRASLPRARAGFAGSAVVGDRIFVFGGEGSPDPSGVFADVDVYEPGTDRWRSLDPMQSPRHGTAAAALDGRIHVPGGADVQAFGAVDTHEAFLPPP